MTDNNEPEVRTTRQARQGIELHAMRYVLAIGLAGAIVGLVLVAAFNM